METSTEGYTGLITTITEMFRGIWEVIYEPFRLYVMLQIGEGRLDRFGVITTKLSVLKADFVRINGSGL